MLKFTASKKDRLDKFLAAEASVSRGQVQRAIKAGTVLVNDKVIAETDFQVNESDVVTLAEFETDELIARPFDYKIVFENGDALVIDKPAGVVVHPGGGHKQDTLSNSLLGYLPEIKDVGQPMRPGIVHRLDEDTSGLLLVAKNQKAYEYFKALFSDRNIEKSYLTLVHGHFDKQHDVIDLPIGKNSTHQKMKVGTGRDAKTEYWVLGEGKLGLDQMALLKVKLHTGRTHQIRVHLGHIGHPVFGDQLYGGHNMIKDSAILNRQFLHAYRLKFQLLDQTWIELFSELPTELKQVLNQTTITYDDSKL